VRTLPLQLLVALRALLALTVVLGVLYPLAVFGVGRVLAPDRADGSFVTSGGRVVGFQPRPSNAGEGYDPTATAASNLGPEDAGLLATVEERRAAVIEANGLAADAVVPPDALTASGSGLDPDISPDYARLQAPRVAAERGLDPVAVGALVDRHVEGQVEGQHVHPRRPQEPEHPALDELDQEG
jgi:K+-transporting ATPase ATPase C chain